jgi:hypothetical protein
MAAAPEMMMIRGTDGLDYEDLTARLLDQPAQTRRNSRLQRLKAANHTQEFLREYLRIYDSWVVGEKTDPGTEHRGHRAAFQHACITTSEHDGFPGLSARQRAACIGLADSAL